MLSLSTHCHYKANDGHCVCILCKHISNIISNWTIPVDQFVVQNRLDRLIDGKKKGILFRYIIGVIWKIEWANDQSTWFTCNPFTFLVFEYFFWLDGLDLTRVSIWLFENNERKKKKRMKWNEWINDHKETKKTRKKRYKSSKTLVRKTWQEMFPFMLVRSFVPTTLLLWNFFFVSDMRIIYSADHWQNWNFGS